MPQELIYGDKTNQTGWCHFVRDLVIDARPVGTKTCKEGQAKCWSGEAGAVLRQLWQSEVIHLECGHLKHEGTSTPIEAVKG